MRSHAKPNLALHRSNLTFATACLIASPPEPRRVLVKVSDKVSKIGDEHITLWLGDGDAYEMDGEMQQQYHHCVPKDTKQVGDKKMRRISVVFRQGKEELYEHDTGIPVENIDPRDVTLKYNIGHTKTLVEGDLYSRNELAALGAYSGGQRGISGNNLFGCDSIIVSGARADCRGEDHFNTLSYWANSAVGAGGMLKSMTLHYAIRVFRSGSLGNPFKALYSKHETNASKLYRYDGLYIISNVAYFEESKGSITETPDTMSPVTKGRLYEFTLQRVNTVDASDGTTAFANQMENVEYMRHCRKKGTMLPEDTPMDDVLAASHGYRKYEPACSPRNHKELGGLPHQTKLTHQSTLEGSSALQENLDNNSQAAPKSVAAALCHKDFIGLESGYKQYRMQEGAMISEETPMDQVPAAIISPSNTGLTKAENVHQQINFAPESIVPGKKAFDPQLPVPEDRLLVLQQSDLTTASLGSSNVLLGNPTNTILTSGNDAVAVSCYKDPTSLGNVPRKKNLHHSSNATDNARLVGGSRAPLQIEERSKADKRGRVFNDSPDAPANLVHRQVVGQEDRGRIIPTSHNNAAAASRHRDPRERNPHHSSSATLNARFGGDYCPPFRKEERSRPDKRGQVFNGSPDAPSNLVHRRVVGQEDRGRIIPTSHNNAAAGSHHRDPRERNPHHLSSAIHNARFGGDYWPPFRKEERSRPDKRRRVLSCNPDVPANLVHRQVVGLENPGRIIPTSHNNAAAASRHRDPRERNQHHSSSATHNARFGGDYWPPFRKEERSKADKRARVFSCNPGGHR